MSASFSGDGKSPRIKPSLLKIKLCKTKNDSEGKWSIVDYPKKQRKSNTQNGNISPHSPGFQQLLDNRPVLNVSNISFDYTYNDIQTDIMAVNNFATSGNDYVNCVLDNDAHINKQLGAEGQNSICQWVALISHQKIIHPVPLI